MGGIEETGQRQIKLGQKFGHGKFLTWYETMDGARNIQDGRREYQSCVEDK
jgi:hypothetical protein